MELELLLERWHGVRTPAPGLIMEGAPLSLQVGPVVRQADRAAARL